MPDDFDDRLDTHEAMLRSLIAMLHAQQGMNERLEGAIEELRTFTRQQVGINDRLTVAIEGLETTQARIETLLARLLRPGGNGREV